MNLILLALILAILATLGVALVSLFKSEHGSKRMVNALTLRVALSVALFILLLLAWQLGLIEPHSMAG